MGAKSPEDQQGLHGSKVGPNGWIVNSEGERSSIGDRGSRRFQRLAKPRADPRLRPWNSFRITNGSGCMAAA
jgi:hypothetical protein